MKIPGVLWAFCLTVLWISAVRAAPNPTEDAGPLWNFYRQADFLALRAVLPTPIDGESEEIVFLRAATFTAFAQPGASARILTQLLRHPMTNAALEIQARELLMLNDRAMFRYRDALEAVAPLLHGPLQQNDRVRSIENRVRLLRAVSDVGPQTVMSGNHATLFPDGRGRIVVSVDRQAVPMVVDTGANLSVMPRRVARALGLKIRSANYAVGSSVGGRVTGDVAVADLAFADGTRIHNAVFLVLPDNAVPVALLGYPVLSALGSIEYTGSGIVFGSRARTANSAPLALAGNDLLLRVQHAGQNILCRLDSGSGRSVFYAPFYRRFGSSLPMSTHKSLRVGGATGTYKFGARQVSSLTISVAGRAFQLSPATILTEPVRGVPNGALACNIGRDVLHSARDYRIDFANMTLSFGS